MMLGLLGGVVGAIGAISQGNAQSSMYAYQAAIAEQNVKIANQNANYELALGEQQAQQTGMKTKGQIGTTRATQGAGGLDVNTGTNAAVQNSEEQLGFYDQEVNRGNAAKNAYNWHVQAFEQQAQAGLYSAASANASTAGTLGAFSSILGGIGGVFSKGMQAGMIGMNTGGFVGMPGLG
jgi:hypothetical protein